MSNKFQLNFGAVPKEILNATVELVAAQLKENGWELDESVRTTLFKYGDVYIIFSDERANSEWNIGKWRPSEYPVYHPLNDWAKWSKIRYDVAVTIKLNDEYSAIVSKDDVKVGCQTFTHTAILEVAEAIKKRKK